MKLRDLLEEIEIQGKVTIAEWDTEKELFKSKYETHDPSYNEYVKHRYGDHFVKFMYVLEKNSGEMIIEVSKQ